MSQWDDTACMIFFDQFEGDHIDAAKGACSTSALLIRHLT
jgi:hypothetical protein